MPKGCSIELALFWGWRYAMGDEIKFSSQKFCKGDD
jgi:hypothetical protein